MLTILTGLGLGVDTARQGSVAAIVVVALVGLVLLKVLASMVARIVMLVIVVALSAAIWTQRTALADCAGKVADTASLDSADIARGSVSCTFFGVEIDVPIPVNA